MPARDFPGLGLRAGYDTGEDGWGNDVNLDLLKASVLIQGGVIGRVAAVPVDPDQGDIYVLTDDPNENTVAVFDDEDWVYLTPNPGWWLFDNDTETYIWFDGAAWADYDAGGGLADAPSDSTAYGRKDAGWVEVLEDAPSDGTEYVRKDGAWEPASGGGGATPFTIGVGFTTALDASEVLAMYTFAETVTFADDWAGSVGDVGNNPAATFTLDVQKNGGSVGSIVISTGGAFTFTTTGTTVAFAAGDQLKIVGPASVGTAADVSITLLGAR